MRYEVPKSFDDIEPHCDDPDCGGYGPIEDFARQLLKERDELVTKCNQLEKQYLFESESNIANMKKISELLEQLDTALEELKREKIQHENAGINFTELNNELLAELKQAEEKAGALTEIIIQEWTEQLRDGEYLVNPDDCLSIKVQRIIEQRNQPNKSKNGGEL